MVSGGNGRLIGGGGVVGRIVIYFYINDIYLGLYRVYGGRLGLGFNLEFGGLGIVFLYYQEYKYRILYVNNDNLVSNYVKIIRDFFEFFKDSFKVWIYLDVGKYWFVLGNFDFRFEELQIYGNVYLVVLFKSVIKGSNLYFLYMIGDRIGFIYVGLNQVMDLRRIFLDILFSFYVYEGGYLGLVFDINLEKVFVYVEGIVDYIVNLIFIVGGELRLFLIGFINRRSRLNYYINGIIVIKVESFINCFSFRVYSEK